MNTIRGLWRPVFGGLIVGGYVLAAFIDPEAAALLEVPAVGVLAWFFAERAITHARES